MRTLIQKILFVRPCSKKMRYSRHSIHILATMVAVTLVVLGLRNAAEAADIFVTTTEPRVSGGPGCSLLEAIYSANLRDNISIDVVNPDGSDNFVTTNCVPGSGNDTIRALGSNDTISAGAGHNSIQLGPGDNRLAVSGFDTILASTGTETVAAASSSASTWVRWVSPALAAQ